MSFVRSLPFLIQCIVLCAMSADFAAAGFGNFLSRTLGNAAPKKKIPHKSRSTRRCTTDELKVKLELGQHIVCYMRDEHGDAFVQRLINNEHVQVPHMFWPDFVNNELKIEYNTRNRLRCYRALQCVLKRMSGDRATNTAMRDGEKPNAKRSRGGAKNATKGPGLGFSLLQFFVDEVQELRSRADSAMLLEKVRQMRATLIEEGMCEDDLPKLEGRAGIQWLYRWRLEYKIAQRANGMQLKVAWRKVLKRVGTSLTNIFRLKAFWTLVHRGHALR